MISHWGQEQPTSLLLLANLQEHELYLSSLHCLDSDTTKYDMYPNAAF